MSKLAGKFIVRSVQVRLKCPKCQKESDIEIPSPIQSKAGKARMAKMTTEERYRNAHKAAQTRRKNREVEGG